MCLSKNKKGLFKKLKYMHKIKKYTFNNKKYL